MQCTYDVEKQYMNTADESMRPIHDALAAFGGVQVTACSDGHAWAEMFYVAMRIDSIDVLARLAMRIDSIDVLARLAHALPLQFSEGRRGKDAASRGLGIVLVIRGIDAANRLDVILESQPLSVARSHEIRKSVICELANCIRGAKHGKE